MPCDRPFLCVPIQAIVTVVSLCASPAFGNVLSSALGMSPTAFEAFGLAEGGRANYLLTFDVSFLNSVLEGNQTY